MTQYRSPHTVREMGDEEKMLNDKDQKNEGNDESEYHFSEEDVNYEVEPEPTKSTPEERGPKLSLLSRLGQSKRMIVSGVVFILLIFVVYKMVTPTVTTAPSTDIAIATAPPPQAVSQLPAPMQTGPGQAAMNQQQAQGQMAQPPLTPEAPQTVPISTPSAPSALPPQPGTVPQVASGEPMAPLAQGAMPEPGSVQQQQPGVPAPGTSQVLATPPIAPGVPQPGASTQPPSAFVAAPAASVNGVPPQGLIAPGASQPATPPSPELGAKGPVTPTIPAVIPVQSPIPTTVVTAEPTLPPVPLVEPGAMSSQLPQAEEARIANLQAQSEKLVTELQANYTQKLNEYAAQNKVLQDQLQTLNAKVAGVESQLAQLLQALARQAPVISSGQPQVLHRESEIEPQIAYNVQAIIPGRAWLKSNSGETLTVAEGDVIRDVGKITRIDPYDGVVEINTGKKVIALSYGNGG